MNYTTNNMKFSDVSVTGTGTKSGIMTGNEKEKEIKNDDKNNCFVF